MLHRLMRPSSEGSKDAHAPAAWRGYKTGTPMSWLQGKAQGLGDTGPMHETEMDGVEADHDLWRRSCRERKELGAACSARVEAHGGVPARVEVETG